MRILVCEFVTGGGMPAGDAIPSGLAHEGDLMLHALVEDLLDVPGIEVVVTRDARLRPMPSRVHSIAVGCPEEAWALWEDLARSVDAVWPIAPETGGVLERMSWLIEVSSCRLFNSRPDAVAIAASKAATAATLSAAGVPVVPVWRADDMDEPPGGGPWVVKPDDGVGCMETRLLHDSDAWARWRASSERAGFVLQPFVPGTPASLSMLCRDGQAWLLTVNRQHVELSGSSFVYRGGIVGGRASSPDLHDLAQRVAAAMPGLFGYVGVDFIATAQGPLVLEVNPRLTTSYVGVRRATGVNVAAAVLGLLHEPPTPPPPVGRIAPVPLHLEPMGWETAD